MTLAFVIELIKSLWAPVLLPLVSHLVPFLAGWLLPSPIQKAAKEQVDVANDEKKLTDSRGNVGNLDHLP